jgi:hypothetical protein
MSRNVKTPNVRCLAETQDVELPPGPCSVFRFRGIKTSINRDEGGEFIEMVIPARPMPESLLKGLDELVLTDAQRFEIEETLGTMTAMNYLMDRRLR